MAEPVRTTQRRRKHEPAADSCCLSVPPNATPVLEGGQGCYGGFRGFDFLLYCTFLAA